MLILKLSTEVERININLSHIYLISEAFDRRRIQQVIIASDGIESSRSNSISPNSFMQRIIKLSSSFLCEAACDKCSFASVKDRLEILLTSITFWMCPSIGSLDPTPNINFDRGFKFVTHVSIVYNNYLSYSLIKSQQEEIPDKMQEPVFDLQE